MEAQLTSFPVALYQSAAEIQTAAALVLPTLCPLLFWSGISLSERRDRQNPQSPWPMFGWIEYSTSQTSLSVHAGLCNRAGHCRHWQMARLQPGSLRDHFGETHAKKATVINTLGFPVLIQQTKTQKPPPALNSCLQVLAHPH